MLPGGLGLGASSDSSACEEVMVFEESSFVVVSDSGCESIVLVLEEESSFWAGGGGAGFRNVSMALRMGNLSSTVMKFFRFSPWLSVVVVVWCDSSELPK